MKKLGFGLMRLPLLDEHDQSQVDMEKTKQLIDAYMEKGFSYFDTAYVYHGGKSESVFGELVAARYPRDSFVLTTKMPAFMVQKEEDYERIFAEQLERCRVDYFDYYFIHAMGEDIDELLKKTNGYEFLLRKKAEGRIRKIGFSYHDNSATLDRILTEHPEVELVQLQLNYIDWDDPNVEAHTCYDICVKHGVQVTVTEPLKGGSLARLPEKAEKILKDYAPDRSTASWGIRFAASPESVLTVLSGMTTMEQLQDNMSYMENFEPLTDGERDALSKTMEIIRESIAIPCTECHYCTDGCPMKISIPEYFALYNNQYQFGFLLTHATQFFNLAARHGKPSACIECGKCEKICPQHLPIINNLKLVKDLFEKEPQM